MIDANLNPTSTPTSQASETPLVTAVKQPVGTGGGSSASSFKGPNQSKKIFGVDRRSLATVVGLTLFFVLAMAGVVISLRQYFGSRDVTAPNAPQSKPAADIVKENTCTLSFDVAAPPGEKDCTTGGFTDNFTGADNAAINARYTKYGDGASFIQNNHLRLRVPKPAADNNNFDPRAAIEPNYLLTGDFDAQFNILTFTSPNNNQGSIRLNVESEDRATAAVISLDHGNANNRIVSAKHSGPNENNRTISESQQKGVALTVTKVKLKVQKRGSVVSTYYDIGAGFVKLADHTVDDKVFVRVALRSDGVNDTRNLAAVTASLDNFAIVCPTTTVYDCNVACTTDTQCQGVNPDYSCSANKCRLTSNPSSAECLPATYQCNSDCTSDDNCQEISDDYVCDATSHKCRLEANPANTSCLVTQYQCNSDCTDTAQCITANANFICSANKCRLSTNTSSTDCTPPDETTYRCDSVCTTNQQCTDVDDDYTCADINGTKRCRLATNTSSASCEESTTVTYACDSVCTTNDQCTGVDDDYTCANINGTKRCRLATNTSSASCQESTTVTIGCNDTCVTNNDCSNSNHICYQEKCRLESNPENTSCSTPTTTTTTTTEVAETPTQPELPAELPKTGPEDWGNWLKAGLAALGVGAVLLLLL
jgi:hypothetical protein